MNDGTPDKIGQVAATLAILLAIVAGLCVAAIVIGLLAGVAVDVWSGVT